MSDMETREQMQLNLAQIGFTAKEIETAEAIAGTGSVLQVLRDAIQLFDQRYRGIVTVRTAWGEDWYTDEEAGEAMLAQYEYQKANPPTVTFIAQEQASDGEGK